MDLVRLFDALNFSAEKHRNQHRKGVEASPYINHPIEVAHVLVKEGAVEDETTLIAALLHDTIEDTDATREEVEVKFGEEIIDLVMEVTDDKRLEKEERKALQVKHAPQLSRRAKVFKIADKICNIREILERPPRDWTLERKQEYLDWSRRVVEGCRGSNENLERCFDDLYEQGKERLGGSQNKE
jgi:guanosine-3',5'-bis(diphosphate) 3'-pyrophosphohydrolase